MSDNSADAAPERRHGEFVRGDRVRIVSGKLQGLRGVISRLSRRRDFVITIDGWPGGVYLMVVDDAVLALEREDRSV